MSEPSNPIVSLQKYLDNIRERTEARFYILEPPRRRWTNFGGDNGYDHPYLFAKICLVGTTYTIPVVWTPKGWRRGR